MDFSKIFGKRNNPEQDFERILQQAANDPGIRPKFYRTFLDYDLYVLGVYEGDAPRVDGEITTKKDDSLKLNFYTINGKVQLPVFSSLKRLQSAVSGEARYIRMNGRVLFRGLPNGVEVVLNPYSDCGKEFTSIEIQKILDGSIFDTSQKGQLQSNMKVILGQPSEYPQRMVDAFISYFKSSGNVNSAYLAQMYAQESGDPPHCVVGIKPSPTASKPLNEILSDLGIIAKETLGSGQFIDIVNCDKDGGLAEYLVKETKPFYSR